MENEITPKLFQTFLHFCHVFLPVGSWVYWHILVSYIIRPPGSGKSTYCKGMSEFLNGVKRKCIVINLDPANSIDCSVDICDLITLEDVMDQFELGPNGGLIYCME